MGDGPVITGIGKSADNLRALMASTLGSFDKRFYRFYPETNPYKKEDPTIAGKVIDLRLDEVLQDRIQEILLDKASGLYAKKFTLSQDPALKKLQTSYDKTIDAFKADPAHQDARNPNGRMPTEAERIELNKTFMADPENRKLVEDLKIKLIIDNSAKMTTRVANARSADTFIMGTPGVSAQRRYFTPVIIGMGDPDFIGERNDSAFKETKLRRFYLDMITDPASKRIVMGHKPNEVIVAGGFRHTAAQVAPSGHYIPYEKAFEMAMEYYTGGTDKHKLLGAKESKRKGDAVLESIHVQMENQKAHFNKQGNTFLELAGLGNNSFVNLQQPIDNFLADIARFKTTKVGDRIKLDLTQVNIKDPKVIKAIEDAFALAQPEIDDKKADYVVARKRALSRNEFLKELLHKHPKEPNDPAARARDVSSATEINTLVELHAVDKLVWQFDPAAAGARPNAAMERDAKRLAAISMFSEAYEVDRLIDNMKKMQEAIKTHYPLNFLSAVEPEKKDVVAGLGAAELEAMRLALNDYSQGPVGEQKKLGRSGGLAA